MRTIVMRDGTRLTYRLNLAQNGIVAFVIEAAVGGRDGFAFFARTSESNLGHVADDGVAVPLVRLSTVLRSVEGRRVDMLKVDPEGGEADLFASDASWLARVDRLMMEFHPEVADPVPIAHAISARGFTFYPAGTLRALSAEFFVQET